jgi:hypothetical protein
MLLHNSIHYWYGWCGWVHYCSNHYIYAISAKQTFLRTLAMDSIRTLVQQIVRVVAVMVFETIIPKGGFCNVCMHCLHVNYTPQ